MKFTVEVPDAFNLDANEVRQALSFGFGYWSDLSLEQCEQIQVTEAAHESGVPAAPAPSTCGLTECQGKPRCEKCAAMDGAVAPAPSNEAGTRIIHGIRLERDSDGSFAVTMPDRWFSASPANDSEENLEGELCMLLDHLWNAAGVAIPAHPNLKGLAAALRSQRQVDEDGTEVGVSRQAADEAAAIIEALDRARGVPGTPVADLQPDPMRRCCDGEVRLGAKCGRCGLVATVQHNLPATPGVLASQEGQQP